MGDFKLKNKGLKTKGRKGSTLVESLIALLIFAIGLSAIIACITASLRNVLVSGTKAQPLVDMINTADSYFMQRQKAVEQSSASPVEISQLGASKTMETSFSFTPDIPVKVACYRLNQSISSPALLYIAERQK